MTYFLRRCEQSGAFPGCEAISLDLSFSMILLHADDCLFKAYNLHTRKKKDCFATKEQERRLAKTTEESLQEG